MFNLNMSVKEMDDILIKLNKNDGFKEVVRKSLSKQDMQLYIKKYKEENKLEDRELLPTKITIIANAVVEELYAILNLEILDNDDELYD